jgi:hypothetical protein
VIENDSQVFRLERAGEVDLLEGEMNKAEGRAPAINP